MNRKIALRYTHLPLTEIAKLLASPVHEHWFVGFEILVAQYEKSDDEARQRIFDFYLAHTHRANNWDLVGYFVPVHRGTAPCDAFAWASG